ncbi:MAG TPA: transketolase C-terminal domain-containing protein [Thermodesulfovibrionales bacterium]|jgi:transketolase|nr:transketolase C-terminal domain-containing protein [Thermodesulfovibrionales bacterium]
MKSGVKAESYAGCLKDITLEDSRLVVLTAENRAAIREITDSLEGRFIDVGIAEQAMIGIAAGLALRGRIPVVHALAAFLTMRGFEFIRTDIGIPGLPVKLVGGVPGFLSTANGPTHQAIEDIALMRLVPAMQIFCPSDEADMLIGLKTMIDSPAPCYMRYNDLHPVTDHSPAFEIGKAEVISPGEDVMILTYGILLKEAITAREILKTKGISAGVVNMRTLKPVDEELIVEAASRRSLIVALEDHFHSGGLYSIICEILTARRVPGNVMPINLKDRWFRPAPLQDVLFSERFRGEDIAESIAKELEKHAEYARS